MFLAYLNNIGRRFTNVDKNSLKNKFTLKVIVCYLLK